ncbi:MAG: PD-(D/E)XK nuclease family protein [Deltaproteobacteria bacterium]
MTERMTTTYSMWSLFRNCRKAAQWRYVLELAPMEKDRHLSFGSLIHECLETWHQGRQLAPVLDHIDRACPSRAQDEEQRRVWHLATAMMRGYAVRYPAEDFEVVALEKKFEGEIINPETGAASRSFVLAGKVDGIVRIGDQHFLLEHKTAAAVDAGYLERLWTDFQITLYAYYVEQALGIRVAGILYNVLVKARLQQSAGETEVEFEARRAELIAKSKTGKSSAKRRMPETDDEFQARLAEKYAAPDMFHRELLYISREQFTTLRAELWELTQAFLDARRRDVWYQNTSFCFQYGKPCPYFALCRSGGSSNVRDNFYEHRLPHEELRGDGDALSPAAATETF